MAVIVKKDIGFGIQTIYYTIGDLHYFFNGAEQDGMYDKEAAFNKKEGFSVSLLGYPSKEARKRSVLASFFRSNSTQLGLIRSREEIGFDQDTALALGLPPDAEVYYESFSNSKLLPAEYLELVRQLNPAPSYHYVAHEGIYSFYKSEHPDWPTTLNKNSLYSLAYREFKKADKFRIFKDVTHPEFLEEIVDDMDAIDDMIAEGFIEFPLLEKLKP
jgi:hypothetical protein